MVVELQVRGAVDAVASDLTFGLPAAGAPLVAAREAAHAFTTQDGDVTITRARGRF